MGPVLRLSALPLAVRTVGWNMPLLSPRTEVRSSCPQASHRMEKEEKEGTSSGTAAAAPFPRGSASTASLHQIMKCVLVVQCQPCHHHT